MSYVMVAEGGVYRGIEIVVGARPLIGSALGVSIDGLAPSVVVRYSNGVV